MHVTYHRNATTSEQTDYTPVDWAIDKVAFYIEKNYFVGGETRVSRVCSKQILYHNRPVLSKKISVL